MLTGRGSVTSWSSWRSFTVTLLWGSGWVPLGKTPSLVITTGWRTLKSRAIANTSEGTSSEGSDTITISTSASCPVSVTEGRAGGTEFITTPTCWLFLFRDEDRAIQGEGEQSEMNTADSLKLHHQHFDERFPGTAAFNRSLGSWLWLPNYKRAVYYPGDQWKDQGCLGEAGFLL